MSSAIGWPFRAGLNMDFTTMDFNRGWPHHIDTGSDEWKTYRIPFTHYITRYNAHSLDIWRKIYTVMMNIDGLLQNCSIFRRKPFSEKRFGSNVLIGAENSIYSIFSANSQKFMMTSSNGSIFRVTGHLCGEFTGPRWIPHTKASDAELWCFLWSVSE